LISKPFSLELDDAKLPLDELAMHQAGFLTKSCRHVTEVEQNDKQTVSKTVRNVIL